MRKVKDFSLIVSARNSKQGRNIWWRGSAVAAEEHGHEGRGEKPSSQAEMADDLFLSRCVKPNYLRIIKRKYLLIYYIQFSKMESFLERQRA